MKKILHQRFNKGEFTYATINQYHTWIKELVHNELNDEYLVITTPTDLEVLDENAVVIKINAKEYTTKELLEIIEKANNYDDLCE